MSQDAEIDQMLADAGDTIRIGEITAPCMLMSQDMPQAVDGPSPGVLINVKICLVRASMFPDLATGATVHVFPDGDTVGMDYRTGPPRKIQDGRVLELWLGKVNG